jgi:hypothetical protein
LDGAESCCPEPSQEQARSVSGRRLLIFVIVGSIVAKAVTPIVEQPEFGLGEGVIKDRILGEKHIKIVFKRLNGLLPKSGAIDQRVGVDSCWACTACPSLIGVNPVFREGIFEVEIRCGWSLQRKTALGR